MRGYTVLPNALPADEVKEINDWIDGLELESRPIGDWEGDVEIHSYCALSPPKPHNHPVIGILPTSH